MGHCDPRGDGLMHGSRVRVFLLLLAMILTSLLFSSCGGAADPVSASKISEIPAQTAFYDEGVCEGTEIDLTNYIKPGDSSLTYTASSDNKSDISVRVSKKGILTVSFLSPSATAHITVGVKEGEREILSFNFPFTVTPKVEFFGISDASKGYFGGNHAVYTLDLSEHIKTNGADVTYTAESQNTDVATVSVTGSVLSATVKAAFGTSKITVKASVGGKVADTAEFTLTAKEYQKIACVGDSLTAGHTWGTEAYPVYLAEKLGKDFTVGNFGLNGASITGTNIIASKPDDFMKYTEWQEYTNSLSFGADLVVIMLGTNDSKSWYFEQKNEKGYAEEHFAEYFADLLDDYAGATLIVVTPPPAVDNTFGIDGVTILEEIDPLIREIAAENGAVLFDYADWVVNDYKGSRSALYRDGLHFTAEVAEDFAEKLLAVIYAN